MNSPFDADWFNDVFASAIIGIIITLLISAVGFLIANRYETKRWRRQRRLAAYTDLLKSLKEFVLLLQDQAEARKRIVLLQDYAENPGSVEPPDYSPTELDRRIRSFKKSAKVLNRLQETINVSYAESEILGTARLSSRITEYSDLTKEWQSDLLNEHPNETLNKRHNKAWDALIAQAQRDLGLKSILSPRLRSKP